MFWFIADSIALRYFVSDHNDSFWEAQLELLAGPLRWRYVMYVRLMGRCWYVLACSFHLPEFHFCL